MIKKNRTVAFIFLTESLILSILFFFSLVGIYGFAEADVLGSAKIFQLSQRIAKNETSIVKIDQQINSIINAEVRYIEFSDSKKYDQERRVVYKITNMAESEKYSEGSMKKAIIRIALEDLNGDGMKEILAYIIQFEYCGKGGGYCTFLILQKDKAAIWKELFRISTYPDIGIANTRNHGYHDIFFRNIIFRVSDKQKVKDRQEVIIWRWDGKQYKPYVKSEVIYDFEAKTEKKTLMRWDVETSSWKALEGL